MANRVYVGYSGAGSFTQSGGTSTTGWFYLGFNSGGSGSYNFSGAATFSPQLLVVGYSGAGVFTQSGGTVTTPNIYVGNNIDSGSTGAYTLSGGTVSASNLYMVAPATGTFTQSGGAATLSSGLYLGGGPTGIGTYNLSGTGTLSAPTKAWATTILAAAARERSTSRAEPTPSAAIYISATIPPARPPTSSAAPATYRPRTSMSPTLRPRRHCSNRPAARTRPTTFPSAAAARTSCPAARDSRESGTRRRRDLSARRGHAHHQRKPCQPGPHRGQWRGRDADGQLYRG